MSKSFEGKVQKRGKFEEERGKPAKPLEKSKRSSGKPDYLHLLSISRMILSYFSGGRASFKILRMSRIGVR